MPVAFCTLSVMSFPWGVEGKVTERVCNLPNAPQLRRVGDVFLGVWDSPGSFCNTSWLLPNSGWKMFLNISE